MKNPIRLAAPVIALFLSIALRAQQVPEPEISGTAAAALATTGTAPAGLTPAVVNSGTAAAPKSDDVVQMSVFNVTGESDHGYQAVNTTSGSRLNTPLKDTSASIQAFTEDFLNDVGATTVEDMLSYAGNMEAESEDSTNGFNDNATRGAGALDNRFRIRGITGATSMDYMDTGVPTDLFNVERSEISGGANSILFGMGAQGGLLTMTSKRANTERNTLRTQYTIGTWYNVGDAWGFNRATFDYNVVLIPHRWALRLLGVWQDGDNNGWRVGQIFHSKRINPLMTIKPWGSKGPTFSFGYERGTVKQSTSRTSAGNSADSITTWLNAGSPLMTSYYGDPTLPSYTGYFNGSNVTSPFAPVYYPLGDYRNPQTTDPTVAYNGTSPVSLVNGAGNNPNFVFVNNNKTLYDTRQTYQTTFPWVGDNAAQTRLPLSMSPIIYSTVGPSGYRLNNLERWNLNIEQNIGNWNFELAYNHNKTIGVAHSPGSIDAQLYADPNKYISSYAWGGGYPSLVQDAYQGEYYMEDQWVRNDLTQSNDGVRLTVNYNLNLKSWGRHRIIGFLEHTQGDLYVDQSDEILVDSNNVPYNQGTNPLAAANAVTRRNYAQPGDFSNYYQGDWTTPITGIVIGDRTFHTTYASEKAELHDTKKKANTAMLALQSYWFNDHLVTTFGARFDDINYRQEGRTQVSPDDPRVLAGDKVPYEWALNGKWTAPRDIKPWTFSAGGVWHITDRFSTFVNFSTNRGAPNLTGFTCLPDGDIPPMVKGQTLDYGVMFDITGDGKWNIRVTKYDTRQMGDYAVKPAGHNDTTGNAALGSTNLLNIYDALYYLGNTGGTGPGALVGSDGLPIHQGPMSLLGGTGNVPSLKYQVIAPSDGLPDGGPPIYDIASVNVRAQGYEVEITASPTKSIDLRFTFAYNNRNRTDIFPEIFAYYDNNMIPKLLAMASTPNPNDLQNYPGYSPQYYIGGGVATVNQATGKIQLPNAQSLFNYVWSQIYGVDYTTGRPTVANSLRSGLNNQLFQQSAAMALRPFQFTFTAKYKFQNNIDWLPNWLQLKGSAIGGAIRWKSYNLMLDPDKSAKLDAQGYQGDGQTIGLDPQMYFGARDMMHGNSLTYFDFFASNRRKIFYGRANLTLQLNVKNVFNQNVVTTGRTNPSGQIRRFYVNLPRQIMLSATIDF